MEETRESFLEDNVEVLQSLSHFDSLFKTDIRLDQVVVGTNFPGRGEVAPSFLFFLCRNPAALKVPLACDVPIDMRSREPAKFFVPDISLQFGLRESERSHPFVSHADKTENSAHLGVVRIMNRGLADKIVRVTGISLIQSHTRLHIKIFGVFGIKIPELRLPIAFVACDA